jgi:hypothetical protein
MWDPQHLTTSKACYGGQLYFFYFTWWYIPLDRILHNNCCENLKSSIFYMLGMVLWKIHGMQINSNIQKPSALEHRISWSIPCQSLQARDNAQISVTHKVEQNSPCFNFLNKNWNTFKNRWTADVLLIKMGFWRWCYHSRLLSFRSLSSVF